MCLTKSRSATANRDQSGYNDANLTVPLKWRSSVKLALGSSWLGFIFGGFLEYTVTAMRLQNPYLIAAGLYVPSFPLAVLSGKA